MHGGLTLVRPDGYVALGEANPMGAESLRAIENVLARQTARLTGASL
jgi:hypothetical protein